MATKRKPIHTQVPPSRMNFRPTENVRAESRGTRPTSTPTSVQEVLVTMVIYVCKKVIFFDINLKVGIYLTGLFLISLISDYVSFPKTYFARSDNMFNQYFVKVGWLWTLLLTVPFLTLTAYTYCCGNRQHLMKRHLSRIAVATFFWYTTTSLFNIIEASYGHCNAKAYTNKVSCLQNGKYWYGFDISGHAFILIYSSLILMEEARAIIGWESIRQYIRNEEHSRNVKQTELSSNPLRNVKDHDFCVLKFAYNKFTPYIRGLFIGMTLLQVLWDVMLFSTMMYYHIMIEKFLSGVFAIFIWYFTYRFWFPHTKVIPDLPGDGFFKYQKEKQEPIIPLRRNNSITLNGKQIPTFMGMPRYGFKSDDKNIENPSEPSASQIPK